MRIRVKLAFGKVLYGWWFEVSVTYSVRYNLIEKVENIYYMTVFHIADVIAKEQTYQKNLY